MYMAQHVCFLTLLPFYSSTLLTVVSPSLSFVGTGNYPSGDVFIGLTTILPPTRHEASSACTVRSGDLFTFTYVDGTPYDIHQLLSFANKLEPRLSSGAMVFRGSSEDQEVSIIRASKYGFVESTTTDSMFLTICRRSKHGCPSLE